MQGYRVLDLNIFYREDWSPETGTTWSETFTIDPYIRESDDYGIRNHETGLTIECDAFETQWLAEQFLESEYGSDFWVFADETQMPSRRIKKLLEQIDLSELPGKSVLTYTDTKPTTM
jgi:hypothetical protein